MTTNALIISLAALLFASAAHAAALRAGAAMVKITPAIGTPINGGVGPTISKEIHDDLYARSLVLDDGTTQLAFVIVDNCLIDRPVFDAAKQIAQRNTAIPAAHILMSCTHTHSAGSACGVHLTDADETYRRELPPKLAEAVHLAAANLAPAQLAFASGCVPQHVFCRRIKLKPGSTYVNQLGQGNQLLKMNWDSPHPDDLDFAGPVDPEVFVLSIRHADGRPLALLANYSLHYVGGVGPGHISADYYGVFCTRMAQLLNATDQSPPFIAMMSNGTSGDINNNDFRVKRPPKPPYAQIKLVAEDVATEVHRVMNDMRYRNDISLKVATTEIPIATRRPTAAQVEAAKQLLNNRSVTELRGWLDNYARDTIFLSQLPETLPIPLQVFRIGDLAIATWPGEIFASTGLELKRRSPKPLFNITMANGWYGYIPPPEQHRLGGYETWPARTSPLETDATVKMIDAFLKLLAGLKG